MNEVKPKTAKNPSKSRPKRELTGDDFGFAEIRGIGEHVKEAEPRLRQRFATHRRRGDAVLRPRLVRPLELGKVGSVEDRQDFGREPGNGLVPLVHDAGVMAPITAQLLQRLPQRGRGERLTARQQPHVEKHLRGGRGLTP